MRFAIIPLLLAIALSTHADEHFLVLGSFASATAAAQQSERASKHFEQVQTTAVQIGAATRHRVVAGPFDNQHSVKQAQQFASNQGFQESWTLLAQNSAETSFEPSGPKRKSSRISEQSSVYVEKFIYEAPVLADEVSALLAPLTGTEVSTQQLLETKDAVNQLFVSNGYVNSGALIPDQQIRNGEVQLEFISGTIDTLDLDSQLRKRYVESRLEIEKPFNLVSLQNKLKLLEQDPLVSRIDARVSPGLRPGEATLNLQVETPPKFRIGITAANDRSPSIGSENGRLDIAARNLTGWGETIQIGTSVTQGLDAHDASISLPITSEGATIALNYSLSDSSVIEEPFDDIDVDSETESLGLVFTLPVMNTLSKSLAFQLTLEARRNQTSLLGLPFSFSEGAVNGESRVAPVRLAIAYTEQNTNDSLAARLSVSRGTSNFDATSNATQPDGDFTSYLAQVQYSKLLVERFHLTFRALAQHASDPLLSVERYALGGVNTVRGYRQNQVVRDNAYLASAELHYRLDLPVFVDLVGFIDWGRGENHDDATTGGKVDLSSIGIGLVLREWHGFSASLYLAHGFDDFTSTEHDLQDDGVHFQVGYYREF